MYKKTITYTDYNGQTQVEDAYFHLSEPELVDMELADDIGLRGRIEKVVASNDNREIMRLFKEIILMSYGLKSEDGKRFVKSDAALEAFKSSAAYSTLFMELASDADAAAAFVNGLLPAGLVEKVAQTSQENQLESAKPISELTDEEFTARFGTDRTKWSREVLLEAMKRKNV